MTDTRVHASTLLVVSSHLVAVIAEDVGYPAGILLRHGRAGDLLVHPPPDRGQVSI